MKKKLILTASILTILLGGCTPQTQPAATTENTEITENVQLSAENIFGGMQRYIEDSFQTCFADYYFNGRSSNASAYFYNKADVTEISKICVAGNTYYYKCMKNGDENVLFWLYSLKLYPFENLQVYPYQLEYEGDQLFYNNQKYILE